MTTTQDNFLSLITTIQKLRSEQGCPWDRKQTTQSLKKYLIEEFKEIIEAIDRDDDENLCEELGDFLYLILMIGEINRDKGSFTIGQIVDTINQKLIRRHPHVFSSRRELDESQLRQQWNDIKERENELKNNS